MRCPNCYQWNRATLPRCIKCGTPLSAEAPVVPSWRADLKDGATKEYIRVDEDGGVDVTPDGRDVLAAEMAELKARKDDGEARLQQLMAETVAEESTPAPSASADPAGNAAPVHPLPDTTPPARRSARVSFQGLPQDSPRHTDSLTTARTGRVHPTPGQWQDTRTYDPLVDDLQHNNVFHQPPRLQELPDTPSRRSGLRRVIRTLTILLVLVVVGLAGAVGFSAWKKYQDTRSDKNRALVTASIKDDLAAHTILIPGEDGQRFYIAELHSTYEVVDGFATVVVPDHVWYDDMAVVTEETMTVRLTPFDKTTTGSQRPMDPIEYEITIPLSPIELVSPANLRTDVTTAMYTMTFKVRVGSAVTINGVDMSDAIDETGKLIYNATVQPKGDNVYNVNVRSPYCRDNSMQVILFREVQEIPLDLAATTYTSTSLSEYEITCTTLPGAEIDILSPHTDLNITNLDSTGEFSFYAVFDKIGDNTVSIQASYPGKKTSRVDYVIYYLPNQDVYTRKAWSANRDYDYAELVGNISLRAEKSQIYEVIGEIDHFVAESPQMAVVYCSADGLSQPVLLENKTKTTWKKGTIYRIYADVYGTYNGMPWLIARYTYLD